MMPDLIVFYGIFHIITALVGYTHHKRHNEHSIELIKIRKDFNDVVNYINLDIASRKNKDHKEERIEERIEERNEEQEHEEDITDKIII